MGLFRFITMSLFYVQLLSLFIFGFFLKLYLECAHQGASIDITLNNTVLLFAVHCGTADAAQARNGPSRALQHITEMQCGAGY